MLGTLTMDQTSASIVGQEHWTHKGDLMTVGAAVAKSKVKAEHFKNFLQP